MKFGGITQRRIIMKSSMISLYFCVWSLTSKSIFRVGVTFEIVLSISQHQSRKAWVPFLIWWRVINTYKKYLLITLWRQINYQQKGRIRFVESSRTGITIIIPSLTHSRQLQTDMRMGTTMLAVMSKTYNPCCCCCCCSKDGKRLRWKTYTPLGKKIITRIWPGRLYCCSVRFYSSKSFEM